MLLFTQPIPLSLYIHMPWCIRKCPYCDFNSHALHQELPEDAYIEKLLADLSHSLPNIKGRELTSIFFGGGTPSLFSPEKIQKLLEQIHSALPYRKETEITLEANPGTVDISHFKNYRAAGINRLSIGIQSLQDEKLKKLGRIHDARTAINAIEAAHLAGFTNFNVDLMYGLPTQTIPDALYDLKQAIALSPPHLSWYHLTLEPNTSFYHNPPPLPEDDSIWKMQSLGEEQLQSSGYEHYEVSAYSKPTHACQHNLNYWEFGDYLGIGAGAHSKITNVETHTVQRSWKIKHPKEYLAATTHFIGGENTIAANEMPFEFMLNALRLYKDIPLSLFEHRAGLPSTLLRNPLQDASEKKLILEENHHIRVTELGRRFLNDLLLLFMP